MDEKKARQRCQRKAVAGDQLPVTSKSQDILLVLLITNHRPQATGFHRRPLMGFSWLRHLVERGAPSGVSVACLREFFNRWKYLKTLGKRKAVECYRGRYSLACWLVISREGRRRENGKTGRMEGGRDCLNHGFHRIRRFHRRGRSVGGERGD